MGKLPAALVVGTCALLAAGPAVATTEFSRGETTITRGVNTITVDNNVKYVNYTADETLIVTLEYSSGCAVGGIAFSGLNLRMPKSFSPRGVGGSLNNVVSDPAAPTVAATGQVTFELTFDTLKRAGRAKQFGMAHLDLVLGVDEDCDGDVDGSVKVGVQVSVSTAPHP